MKRLLLFLTLIAAAASASMAQSRHLLYEVKWKWGLVDMSAGLAHVSVEQAGDAFSASLSGHSVPWEGRIYTVSEELKATAGPTEMLISYINGTYSKPRAHHPAEHPEFRNILGEGSLDASPKTMEAVSVMAHMLGLYYYAGVIDFGAMRQGDVKSIPFRNASGTESVMQIEYLGDETDCYSIRFKFSFCPYQVDCLIDKLSRTPAAFKADIAIGHVEMNLAGSAE